MNISVGNVAISANSFDFVAGNNITLVASGGGKNPGVIRFDATGGGGIQWINQTSSLNPLVVNQGYVANSASTLIFTLPNNAEFGSAISIVGLGSGGWILVPGLGQLIVLGITSSNISVSSSNQNDAVNLICTVANSQWNIVSSVGNIRFN